MIINKAILEAHGVCESGYDKFVELFGEGAETYDNCLAIVEELERVDPENTKAWVMFIKNLKGSVKFYQMQPENSGEFISEFRVFNPISGKYAIATTLVEAKAIRETYIAEFVAHNIGMFAVSHAYITGSGTELWGTVSDADLV